MSTVTSTVTTADLDRLKQTVLLGDEDVEALRLSGEVLDDQVEDVLDVWYGFVGSTPHLLESFTNRSDGQPNADYLAAVRVRFADWIRETSAAEYDEAWLTTQLEIGRRHHRGGKNRTDGVDSTENIPLRYVIALIYPITATLRPFLEKKGHSPAEVDQMHDAWRKSVLLQIALWSRAYVPAEDW